MRLGLFTSLNRPDGNVTGVTTYSSTLLAKRLELVPHASMIGFLTNPTNLSNQDDTADGRC